MAPSRTGGLAALGDAAANAIIGAFGKPPASTLLQR